MLHQQYQNGTAGLTPNDAVPIFLLLLPILSFYFDIRSHPKAAIASGRNFLSNCGSIHVFSITTASPMPFRSHLDQEGGPPS
jgi:hypothetical protein